MADQDEGCFSPEDCSAAEPDFVEMDVTGRYGRYNDILGKGAFKTVYRAFDEVDGIEVAWNQVKIHDLLQSSEELDRLYSEVHLLRSLKHKNIIKFYTSWVDVKNKNVNFITEIFNSGTLRQYRKKHKHVDIKAVKNWARQILRGLLYLHSHDPPIIHRDLKCDNIFVNGNNGEVKIGDLGLATILRQAHAAHSVIGTPEFMAPELYEEEYNELVDIYSFGMCLLELVTFEYPYSECTNAAQIYKKVTSGKKPAALEKVRDPDVRKFIENCLAVASKRLPARELLSDPFLQNDGSKEQVECSQTSRKSLSPQVVVGKDEIPEASNKEESGQHGYVQDPSAFVFQMAHHEPNDSKSDAHIEASCSKDQASNEERELLTESASFSKYDQPMKILDFRVKGKKRDDNTVSLRFRIANIQGHVRHIHFLFDVEGDTAISVASEMVEELQLSDQDVTTIAEMIDAKILALVPEWNPAASFEDSGPETVDLNLNTIIPDPEHEKLKNKNDVDFASEARVSSLTQELCPSLIRSSACDGSLVRGEGMMHGRFEEVTYNHGSSDYSPSSSGAPPFVSQRALDHQVDGESIFNEVDRTGSPDFDTFEPSVWTMLNETGVDLHKDLPTGSQNVENAGCAFNDLVECQRNAGGSKYTHQSWERIMNLTTCSDEVVNYTASEREESGMGLNVESLWSSGGSDPITPIELTDGEEDFDEELKLLALEQEREVLELRKKHEKAILEAKNRRERKRGMTPPSNPIKSGPQSSFPSTSDAVDSSISDSDSHKCLEGSFSGLNQDFSSSHPEIRSQLSTVKGYCLNRGSVHSERISYDELAAITNRRVDEDKSINLLELVLLDSQISTTWEIETCTTSKVQDNQGQLLPESLSMVCMETVPLCDQIVDKIESGASVQGCFVDDDNEAELYGVTSDSVEAQMSKLYPHNAEGLCNVCVMNHASAIIYPINAQGHQNLCSTVFEGDTPFAAIHPTVPEIINPLRATDDVSCCKTVHEGDSVSSIIQMTDSKICNEFRVAESSDWSDTSKSNSCSIQLTDSKICNEFRATESSGWSDTSKSNSSCECLCDAGSASTTMHPRNPLICNEFFAKEHCSSSNFLKPNDIHIVGESINARASSYEVGTSLESSSKLSTSDRDRQLQLKKEQLQRSIAELEAKTLEGLEHALVANGGSNGKPTCSSSRHATSGIASPSSAFESKKF